MEEASAAQDALVSHAAPPTAVEIGYLSVLFPSPSLTPTQRCCQPSNANTVLPALRLLRSGDWTGGPSDAAAVLQGQNKSRCSRDRPRPAQCCGTPSRIFFFTSIVIPPSGRMAAPYVCSMWGLCQGGGAWHSPEGRAYGPRHRRAALGVGSDIGQAQGHGQAPAEG